MIKYTNEQIEKAMELYAEGKKYDEITEITGMKHRVIGYYVTQKGLPKRLIIEKPKTKKSQEKICSKCHKKNPSNANYCYYCGTEIRTEAEILIHKLDTVIANTSTMNSSLKDETIKIIIEVINYLKK